jgi:membrane protease YdiL (CAAX protease family)
VLAWFVPPALSLAGAAVFFLVFPSLFDAGAPYVAQQLAQYGEVSDAQMTIIISATFFEALTFAPFFNMLFAFGEEAGWRDMLLPLLRERYTFRQSS